MLFPFIRKVKTLQNYRPVSLILICGKVFERLIYSLFEFNFENELISSNQSGFKPGILV